MELPSQRAELFLTSFVIFWQSVFKRAVPTPVEIFQDCCNDEREPMKRLAQEHHMVDLVSHHVPAVSRHSLGGHG